MLIKMMLISIFVAFITEKIYFKIIIKKYWEKPVLNCPFCINNIISLLCCILLSEWLEMRFSDVLNSILKVVFICFLSEVSFGILNYFHLTGIKRWSYEHNLEKE